MGTRARREAARQTTYLCRHDGQLFPRRRRASRRRISLANEESALRRRGRIRPRARALLERRSEYAQCDLAPALPRDVPAEDRGAHPQDGAAWRRPDELEVLARVDQCAAAAAIFAGSCRYRNTKGNTTPSTSA